MQTHLRTRAPFLQPRVSTDPSWRWSAPLPEGRWRNVFWSLSHGRALLVTSTITPVDHWCLHLLGQQCKHLSSGNVMGNRCSLFMWTILLSSWRASKVMGRRQKYLFLVLVRLPCPKDPTSVGLRGKLSLPALPGGCSLIYIWWWLKLCSKLNTEIKENQNFSHRAKSSYWILLSRQFDLKITAP